MAENIVFVTGHEFGIRALEGMLSSRPFIDGRLRFPLVIGLDSSHAAKTVGYADAGCLAREYGMDYVSTRDGSLRSSAEIIGQVSPDYLVVIGWSWLVAPEILSLPAGSAQNVGGDRGLYSSIGMHPTQLPRGRGRAPIPWTIIKGLQRTALSVFFMAPSADSGPLIAQYHLSVREGETSASLFRRFAHLHHVAGREMACAMASSTLLGQAQDEKSATTWPRRNPDDGLIHPGMDCLSIDRLVRALSGPYPRAYIQRNGRNIPVVATVRSPSKVTTGRSGVLPFSCADGRILLVLDESVQVNE
ncbi:formyltransferase family protein [Streptomyces cyaneofuscatus]